MEKAKPLFSLGTQKALQANVEGYVEQEACIADRISELKEEHGLANLRLGYGIVSDPQLRRAI